MYRDYAFILAGEGQDRQFQILPKSCYFCFCKKTIALMLWVCYNGSILGKKVLL